ncbi:MAG: hypothetical protein V4469_02780 [Patescibacteria group bacterium]
MNLELLTSKEHFKKMIEFFLKSVSELEEGKYNSNKQEVKNGDEKVILEPSEQSIQSIGDMFDEITKPDISQYIETLTESQQKTIKDAIIRAEIYLSAFKQQ